MSVESSETIFTVAYILIVVCIIAPPTEFVSAGLTVQNLLGNFLGSEHVHFINYHIKRTTSTMIVHSVLPLVYYVVLGWTSPRLDLLSLHISYGWRMVLLVCIVPLLAAANLAWYWSRKRWLNHPITQQLRHHTPAGNTWLAVASSINIEFRRIDKFTTGIPGRRLIVTDSWIIQTSTYSINLAHQSDVHLTLVGTEEHQLAHDSPTGVQYLTLTVSSINPKVKDFNIRLNAMEYSDLKEKLRSPVRHAQDVIIHQSLSDRFLAAFREHAEKNDPCYKDPNVEIESCIGCMQKEANVKLRKLCDGLDRGDCNQCFCRPMWCLECMGKWFASRQDQQQPETWLASRSPCPTCRATFCILDVCLLV